ncbi:hypothetical protein ACFE04_011221 [Oxalis oulophora]
MTSKTVAKDIITLRGSAAIVIEFFVLFIIVEFRVLLRSRYMVFLCSLRKTRGYFGYNEQKPTAEILERWNFSIKSDAEFRCVHLQDDPNARSPKEGVIELRTDLERRKKLLTILSLSIGMCLPRKGTRDASTSWPMTEAKLLDPIFQIQPIDSVLASTKNVIPANISFRDCFNKALEDELQKKIQQFVTAFGTACICSPISLNALSINPSGALKNVCSFKSKEFKQFLAKVDFFYRSIEVTFVIPLWHVNGCYFWTAKDPCIQSTEEKLPGEMRFMASPLSPICFKNRL